MNPASASNAMKRRHGYSSARRQGHRRAPARDEPAHNDQVAAAFVQSPFGLLEPFVPVADEEPLRDPVARRAPDRVRGVVAEDRTAGGDENHEPEDQVAARCEHTGSDHRGLARHERDDGVERRDGEEKRRSRATRRPGRSATRARRGGYGKRSRSGGMTRSRAEPSPGVNRRPGSSTGHPVGLAHDQLGGGRELVRDGDLVEPSRRPRASAEPRRSRSGARPATPIATSVVPCRQAGRTSRSRSRRAHAEARSNESRSARAEASGSREQDDPARRRARSSGRRRHSRTRTRARSRQSRTRRAPPNGARLGEDHGQVALPDSLDAPLGLGDDLVREHDDVALGEPAGALERIAERVREVVAGRTSGTPMSGVIGSSVTDAGDEDAGVSRGSAG